MPSSFEMFVGANNDTGSVDIVQLCAILDDRFDGYTIVETRGLWRGVAEDSVMVIVSAAHDLTEDVEAAARVICRRLAQHAVAIRPAPVMSFVTV